MAEKEAQSYHHLLMRTPRDLAGLTGHEALMIATLPASARLAHLTHPTNSIDIRPLWSLSDTLKSLFLWRAMDDHL